MQRWILGTGHYSCGGGGEKSWGGPGLFFFREKGWAKREFHDDWGWVINSECIDGAPVLSDYIHASVSEHAEDSFFFNGEYLSEYMKKSVNNRGDMPGSAYIRKILEFNEKHIESGELYAEFLRGSCKEIACVAGAWK